MGDVQRWSVIYTKHVKQKRKVYQDGFLEFHSSRRKVMLYDESDKLLESRFLKKDDVIKSGETLAFECYLVEIGYIKSESRSLKEEELPKHHSPPSRKPVFVKARGRLNKLSPSQKMIRDFKKAEVDKLLSSPSCIDMRNSVTEWQVLYTSQVTQKAKKFHDGFLKLILTGSERRQVMLYDANRTHLISRFLNKDETVCLGGSLAFNGHLVEIEALHIEDCKPVHNSTPSGENQKPYGKSDEKVRLRANKNTIGGMSSVRIHAVHDILSRFRRPNESNIVESVHPTLETLVNVHAEDCHPRSTDETRAPDHNCRAVYSNQETKTIAIEKTKACQDGRDEDPEKIPEFSFAGITTKDDATVAMLCEEYKTSNSTSSNGNCVLKDQSSAEEVIQADTGASAVETDEFPSFDLGF